MNTLISVGIMIPKPCTERIMTMTTAAMMVGDPKFNIPILSARFIPEVIAAVARAGIRNSMTGTSLLITCVLACGSRPFITLLMTMPMKRSMPVQVPPVRTWR
jgi:hypothetical protein